MAQENKAVGTLIGRATAGRSGWGSERRCLGLNLNERWRARLRGELIF